MLLVQGFEQVQLLALFLEGVAVILNVGDGALHVGFGARDECAAGRYASSGTTKPLPSTI